MMQNIKQGIEGHPMDWYSDVFDLVFPNVNSKEINTMWKQQLKEDKKKRKEKEKEKDEDSDDD